MSYYYVTKSSDGSMVDRVDAYSVVVEHGALIFRNPWESIITAYGPGGWFKFWEDNSGVTRK